MSSPHGRGQAAQRKFYQAFACEISLECQTGRLTESYAEKEDYGLDFVGMEE